jgi:hypothetical protein
VTKKVLILLSIMYITGCAVVKDAHTELRKEIVGFKTEWDRVILKKDVSHDIR